MKKNWKDIAADIYAELKSEGGAGHARAVIATLDFRLNMKTNRHIGKPRPPATPAQRAREEQLYAELRGGQFTDGGIKIIVRNMRRLIRQPTGERIESFPVSSTVGDF